jgi:hypothetical protein
MVVNRSGRVSMEADLCCQTFKSEYFILYERINNGKQGVVWQKFLIKTKKLGRQSGSDRQTYITKGREFESRYIQWNWWSLMPVHPILVHLIRK